jgi:hypothetical protein
MSTPARRAAKNVTVEEDNADSDSDIDLPNLALRMKKNAHATPKAKPQSPPKSSPPSPKKAPKPAAKRPASTQSTQKSPSEVYKKQKRSNLATKNTGPVVRTKEILPPIKSTISNVKPTVGQECVVRFSSSQDFLGIKRETAGGWFLGNITKVKKEGRTQSVDVKFWDHQVETIALPNEDFALLYSAQTDDGIDSTKLMFEDGRLFGEFNPHRLRIGDLVFCKTQNGKYNSAYYRGRVVSVGNLVLNTAEPVCDIAYDDGDYEVNIPYTHDANVFKVVDGGNNFDWLLHLKLQYGNRVGTIHSVSEQRGVCVEFQTRKGRTVYEDHPFAMIVELLFRARKQETDTKVKTWPIFNGLSAAKSPATEKSKYGAAKEELAKRRMPSRAASSATATKRELANKAKLNNKAPAAKRKDDLESTVDAVNDSDYDSADEDLPQFNDSQSADMQEMPSRLSDAFSDALFSSDSLFGARLLHNNLPRRSIAHVIKGGSVAPKVLLAQMVRVILTGPRTDAEILYPDLEKVSTALNYIKTISTYPGGMDNLLESLPLTFIDECFTALSSPQYMQEEEDSPSTPGALERLNLSLRLQLACTELLELIFHRQLHGALRLTLDMLDSVFERAVVRDIVRQRRRSHKATFERAVSLLAKLYTCYGYEYVDILYCRGVSSLPSESVEHLQPVRDTFVLLAKKLGLFVSYLGWLYCSVDFENTITLARIIGAVVNDEIQKSVSTQMIPDEEKKMLKLKFLLQFDKHILPQLQPALADRLEVALSYNTLFAFGSKVKHTPKKRCG